MQRTNYGKTTIKAEKPIKEIKLKKKSQKPNHHKEMRTKGETKQMTLKNTTNTKEKTATRAP